MKSLMLKIFLFLLCCSTLQMAMAEEFRSGLLLVSKVNQKRTKVIPINRKVKIWTKDKVYRVKILAVDDEAVYLTSGDKIYIKDIASIKRKRIMFRDVGNASVVTGIIAGKMMLKDNNNEPVNRRASDYDVGDELKQTGGSAILATFIGVGTGVATLVATPFVSVFEPRYVVEKWQITALNPEKDVRFIQNLMIQNAN